jgi:transcriptional regulator with XRE-family HTH domain
VKREDAEEYTQALGQVVSGGWRQIALGQRLGVPAALGLSVQDWVKQRLGGYVKLSLPELKTATAELTAQGLKQREIADVVGVNQATVSRATNDAHASAKRDRSQEYGGDSAGRDAHASAEPPRLKLPTDKQWADLDAARARSQQIQQHRRDHPDQFAAEEIFSVLTFALNEADKWAPHVACVGKTPPGQWALLGARLETISALVRRLCDTTRSEAHRTDAGHAAERGYAPPS